VNGIGSVGADLARAFRERPALVVGGGVLALIGITLLNRQGSEEAGPAVDPSEGLFPGVPGAGGTEIPGSGSVPFGGYPVAGDGSYVTPPDLGTGFDLPIWGLSCNGEPKPNIAGLPGTWQCTDDGWVYVPPAPVPSPTPTPTTPATKTVYRPAGKVPSNASGWAYFKTGAPVYDLATSGQFNGSYPVKLRGPRGLGTAGSRWVTSPRSGLVGSASVSVRRISSTTGLWIDNWVPSNIQVFGLSTPSAKVSA
jgi:hypothetical protein